METPAAALLAIDALLSESNGGHCDIDLEGLAWPGIQALFDGLQPTFTDVSVVATSEDTVTAQVQDVSIALRSVERGRGSAQLSWRGGRGWLTNIQFFVSHDGGAEYGLQLTFFPGDLAQPLPDAAAFVAWVQWARLTSGASRARIDDRLLTFTSVDGQSVVSIELSRPTATATATSPGHG